MRKTKTKTFTDEIRDAIVACGLSQREICRRAKVEPAILCRFLKGKMFMFEDTLNALAGAVGLHVIRKQVRYVAGKKTN